MIITRAFQLIHKPSQQHHESTTLDIQRPRRKDIRKYKALIKRLKKQLTVSEKMVKTQTRRNEVITNQQKTHERYTEDIKEIEQEMHESIEKLKVTDKYEAPIKSILETLKIQESENEALADNLDLNDPEQEKLMVCHEQLLKLNKELQEKHEKILQSMPETDEEVECFKTNMESILRENGHLLREVYELREKVAGYENQDHSENDSHKEKNRPQHNKIDKRSAEKKRFEVEENKLIKMLREGVIDKKKFKEESAKLKKERKILEKDEKKLKHHSSDNIPQTNESETEHRI
ncbi:hypothetical protein JW979_07210, partial [bacterium]|nr:hypothetical protein [candidate division CSSED10-310 bacterium]